MILKYELFILIVTPSSLQYLGSLQLKLDDNNYRRMNIRLNNDLIMNILYIFQNEKLEI